MQNFQTENLYRNANTLSFDELMTAMESKEILQGSPIVFTANHELRFDFGGISAVMPFNECVMGAEKEAPREVVALSRVGTPTCFVIQNFTESENGGFFVVSRAKAQVACKENYINNLTPGDIIPCLVTHIDHFGAFCDVGCGISALLPISNISVSRIATPNDRLHVGQQIFCALRNVDEQDRLVLTMRELLGTWEENASKFQESEVVIGIVRSVESYGTFIELTPNLCGLAEPDTSLNAGQVVSVYIKSILPDRMKVKLAVSNKNVDQNARFDVKYVTTSGHMDNWTYSTPSSAKQIATDFAHQDIAG